MGGFAAILIAVGIIGVIYGLIMRRRASRVTSAPFVKTGEIAQKGAAAAGPGGMISAEGNVSCPQPLMSPVTNTMCLFYDLKVTAEWKDGDTTKTKELTHEKRAAQFAIDDGSGPVWIDAREGGDFEPDQKKSETKGTGLLGGITGQDLVFGNYRVSTGILSLGTKYTVVEEVLPAVPKLYACGKLGSSNEITKPGMLSNLLLTNKSRNDYLAEALKHFKIGALFVGAPAIGVGAILGVVASLMGGGDDAKAKTTPSATVAVTATATATATDTATATATGAATPPPHAGTHTTPPTKATTAATTKPGAPPPTKPTTKKK